METDDPKRAADDPNGARRGRSSTSRRWLYVAGGFLALAALAVLLFDWNWLKGPIERRVAEATGRTLILEGPLSGSIGRKLRLRAEKVRFDNPEWARADQMLEADAVSVALDFWPLLSGNIRFAAISLEHPVLALETSKQGAKNWLFDREQKDESKRVEIGTFEVRDGKIVYFDPVERTDIAALVSSPPQDHKLRERFPDGVQFDLSGRLRGQPLRGAGAGSSVLGLQDATHEYPFVARATWGKTSGSFDGSITGLQTLRHADAQVSLAGDNLADLREILGGVAVPPTRPYDMRAHVKGGGDAWQIAALKGRVGESDISGNVDIRMAAKPVIKAKLKSQLLDLADLGALTSGGGRNANTAGRKSGTRALPDVPFTTEKWGTLEADVELAASQIRRDGAIPWRDLNLHATVKDSVIKLKPLQVRLAGGQFQLSLTLDGSRKPIAASATGSLRNVKLTELAPKVVPTGGGEGRFTGNFNLTGKGNSVADILGTANGDVQLMIGGAYVSNLIIELVGLDGGEALGFLFGGDRKAELRCGVASFAVKEGLMESLLLVVDTSDTAVPASGRINLRDESLDLRLDPKPKDVSILSLRSPLLIGGTFKQPRVRPEAKALGARLGAAVALGLINPFAALLALIETGPGEDSDCVALIKTTQATSTESARASGAKAAAAKVAPQKK